MVKKYTKKRKYSKKMKYSSKKRNSYKKKGGSQEMNAEVCQAFMRKYDTLLSEYSRTKGELTLKEGLIIELQRELKVKNAIIVSLREMKGALDRGEVDRIG